MTRTILDTPVITPVLRWVSCGFLWAMGWRREGVLPDTPKYVLIVAPHTSNWDLPFALAFGFVFRVKGAWMGKHTLFRWPFGLLFRWLGGIPIERSHPHGVVGHTIDILNESDRLVIGLAPEGTRKRVSRWKTGFYHIAAGAHVPIVLAYLDYRRKVGGFGPVFLPSGDVKADMAVIQAFYATVTAKRPENTGPDLPTDTA